MLFFAFDELQDVLRRNFYPVRMIVQFITRFVSGCIEPLRPPGARPISTGISGAASDWLLAAKAGDNFSCRKKFTAQRPEIVILFSLSDENYEQRENSRQLCGIKAGFLVAFFTNFRAKWRLLMIPTGTINEILHHKGNAIWAIAPDTTVFEAIQIMDAKNVGALLVTENEKLVGLISERDYTRKVALKGKSSRELRVREILSEHVVRVSPNHSIEECMKLMTEHRVRHLPVLDGEKIIGVISIGDLVNWIISAQSTTIHQLETYITGYPTSPES